MARRRSPVLTSRLHVAARLLPGLAPGKVRLGQRVPPLTEEDRDDNQRDWQERHHVREMLAGFAAGAAPLALAGVS